MIEVSGVNLAFAAHGAGGKPLLAVHGYTGAKEDFTEWLDPLADRGWHAVAVDLRGHGASEGPTDPDGYTLEQLAEDLLGVADSFGWDEFVLVAHSMGAMVAQLAALSAPERVRGLVLMCTGHGSVDTIDPDLIEMAMGIVAESGMDGLAEALATLTSPLETEAHIRLLSEREGYAEYGDRNLRAVHPVAYQRLGHAMLGAPDRLELLAALDVPTLVISGELDHNFLEPSRRLAAAIPGAVAVELEAAGHSPQFETPESWWAAVSSFLDTLG